MELLDRVHNLSPEQRELLLLRLRQQQKQNGPEPIPSLARDTASFPLSFAQQRLWFLDQLEPGIPTYHISEMIRLSGSLDYDALYTSFMAIVERHESLRTLFISTEGQPVQMLTEVPRVAMPLIDMHHIPEPDRVEQAVQLATDEARQPFDLTQGPLWRIVLYRINETEHLLLLVMHHIISDGWSMGVLVQEVAAIYEATCATKEPSLPHLPVHYVDFAQWQRDSFQGDDLERNLAFWKEQLAGRLPVLDLPTDRPRPGVRTYHGARQPLAFPRHITAALNTLSQQEGCTLFMSLLAAFQVLLYRYTDQEDILIGSPIAGRNRTELEGLIGFFVNTLVLRADLSGDPTFRTLLARVRDTAQAAYVHQDMPFEYLVETLRPARDLSRTPIFQTMFILQNTLVPTHEIAGIRLSRQEFDNGTSKFDIMLELYDDPDGLHGWFEYNTDLFDGSTIRRMIEHFQCLVEAIIAHPDTRISRMPLLTNAHYQETVLDWNATTADYPQDVLLHDLIGAQAQRTPDMIALRFEDYTRTYRELDEQANQLAHYLQHLGVGPESRVGICMERSLELVIGLLGILKAGGAYVPLDPEYPRDRLAFMLADAEVSVLLTQSALYHHQLWVETPPDHNNPADAPTPEHVTVVCLDTNWPAIAASPTSPPDTIITPDYAAYVIYTSGSTGKPKGVVNTHRGICNRLLWMQEQYQLTSADRVLQKTPFSFDVSVWEFFWPLLAGAQLVVARPGGHRDSHYLTEVITTQHITTLHFVPSMLQLFLEDPQAIHCNSLRRIICSGEALPAQLQQRCLATLDAELHNLYGPTEAAVDVTYWACQRDDLRSTVPIGKPIANIQMYVLNHMYDPVPMGVAGDLYIAGVGLARGYLNRPDLTAERFMPNPFAHEMHGSSFRLYATGDRARYLPDGNLEFLGRADFQVKVRGFRIELSEIEAVLHTHPALREVVVVARTDTLEQQRLVAYIVPETAEAPSVSDMHAFLKLHLPEYMVPAAFVVLEALPLSPNGKVDRRALPEPEQERPELNVQYVAPRTGLEQAIAAVWQEVLQIEQVGLHDNFFELGGHSLLMVQVHNKVRSLLPCEVSMVDLFQYPTIHDLVGFATQGQQRDMIAQKSQSRGAARRGSIGQRMQLRQHQRTNSREVRS